MILNHKIHIESVTSRQHMYHRSTAFKRIAHTSLQTTITKNNRNFVSTFPINTNIKFLLVNRLRVDHLSLSSYRCLTRKYNMYWKVSYYITFNCLDQFLFNVPHQPYTSVKHTVSSPNAYHRFNQDNLTDKLCVNYSSSTNLLMYRKTLTK